MRGGGAGGELRVWRNTVGEATPRQFWQRVRKLLENKEMSCRTRQKSVPFVHPSQKSLGARKSEGMSKRAHRESMTHPLPVFFVSMGNKGLSTRVGGGVADEFP